MMSNAQLRPRDIILNVSADLFHRKSYGAVSVEEIIEASGLTAATFHRNFQTKSELGCAWLERLNQGWHQCRTGSWKSQACRKAV